MVELKRAKQQLWRFRSLTKQWRSTKWPEFRLSIISPSSQQVCEYGGPTMWAPENFSHQHRWSDLVCLRGLPVSKSCSPLAYHERMDGGVFRSFRFLDLCQQGLSACILNLARHNLLKISQLMKLHDLSYPVLRKGVQRHASLLQICRNTWMWVNILSN